MRNAPIQTKRKKKHRTVKLQVPGSFKRVAKLSAIQSKVLDPEIDPDLKARIESTDLPALTERELINLIPKPGNTNVNRKRGTYDGELTWTPKRILAARLLSTGEFNVEETAKAIGVHEQTIYYWRAFSCFERMINKLALDTGLVCEGSRVKRIKKRLTQFNHLIDRKTRMALNGSSLELAGFTIPQLASVEAKLLGMLEIRDKGADSTLNVTFGDTGVNKKKVNNLESIMAELPEEAAKELKAALAKKAQELIRETQKSQEEENESTED